MKSSKPSCDRTLFSGAMVRYAPVWVLYCVGCALLVLLVLGGPQEEFQRASSVVGLIRGLGVGNFCYALAVTQVLFGYLMEPRLCYGMHALPVTRDRMFRVYCMTGLAFFAIPCVVLVLSTAMSLRGLAYLTGWVVLANVLQFVFFYGAAVLSVFLSGNRIAMALIYVIVGLAGLLAAWFAQKFYEPMLYGITLDVGHIRAASPVFAMTNWRYLEVATVFDPVSAVTKLDGVTLGWGWRGLSLYAGMGVLCFPISQVLYRRRKLEIAGDFLAVDKLKWVFLAMFTMAAGCAFYVIADNFRGAVAMIFLPVGMIAGYFVGLMLLRRQTNVFRLKVLIPLGAMMLTLLLTAACCLGDVAGIVRRVPDLSEIESVTLTDYYAVSDPNHILTAQEDIEVIRQIQTQCLEEYRGKELATFWSSTGDSYLYPNSSVEFTYNLTNGKTMERSYPLTMGTPAVEKLERILSRMEYVVGFPEAEIPEYLPKITRAQVQVYEDNGYHMQDVEDRKGLLEAIASDCREGTMARNYQFHWNEEDYTGYLELQIHTGESEAEDLYVSVTIRPRNRHLTAWLEGQGILTDSAGSTEQ